MHISDYISFFSLNPYFISLFYSFECNTISNYVVLSSLVFIEKNIKIKEMKKKFLPGEEGNLSVMWYLLKTWVDREEELVKEIRRAVPDDLYKECFVIYQERVWTRQQRNILHVKPLFPGCAFLTCQQSTSILSRIERIPAISLLIACGSLTILRMTEEDGKFLEKISGEEHIVKLSYVLKDEQGNICRLSEPLNDFEGKIDRIQFKKRYAMVHHRLWGEERIFVLGIILKEDFNRVFLSEGRFAGTIPAKDRFAEDTTFPVEEMA